VWSPAGGQCGPCALDQAEKGSLRQALKDIALAPAFSSPSGRVTKNGAFMKIDRHTGRMFLQGMGVALLAVPFLRSLVLPEAKAQALPPRLRFIAIKSYGTQQINAFNPTYSRNVDSENLVNTGTVGKSTGFAVA